MSTLPVSSVLIRLARATAERHRLDPAIVCALIEQESDWQTYSVRYEPAFRARYVANLVLSPTEEFTRSVSWGLMQLMGQVAREHGFKGKFLSSLCDPEIGLELGCEVFKTKLAAAAGDISAALNLWNGGANLNYAPQVIARVEKYQ
jgi:soluble lytic murein transglycosylase-like protein